MAVDSTERVFLSDSSGTNGSQKHNSDNVLDLGSFMDHYYQVRDQLWPLSRLVVELQRIRRWENYWISLSVAVSLSLLLLYPRALIAIISSVLFMLILAGNQYVLGSFIGTKRKMRPLVAPKMINEDTEVMEVRSKEEKNRQKSLRDYRYIVKKADDAVIELCHVLDTIKSVYMWDDPRTSTNVCFFLLVVSLSMLWITVSTLLSFLSLFFFCFNQHFLTKTKSIFLNISSYFPQLRFSQQISQTQTPRVTSVISNPLSHRSSSRLIQPTVDDLSSSGEANERSSRKDKSGTCYKCGASFSLLKRKHPCNNCGHVYCGSCTVKVTRASLGATSPAAFQQTVRVCQECKSELDKTTDLQQTS